MSADFKMATAEGKPSDKDEDREKDVRHTCSLCMEPYRGRCPKLLPCFHTFCLPCLIALEASVTQATTSETGGNDEADLKGDDDNRGTSDGSGDVGNGDDVTARGGEGKKPSFLCPTCRAPVAVPEGGVASLQTNFYVEEDVSADHLPPPVLCDMCEDGNQQPATHTCQQCHVTMCRTCRRCHDKLMPKHHVTGVSAGQAMKSKKENTRFCLVHQDQALCFHCRQCEVSVCLHCKLTSHEGHDTVDVTSAALLAKKEMPSLIITAQEQLRVMESSLQQVDGEERQLSRHTEEVRQGISARCDSLLTWARQARDLLLEELAAKDAAARTQLAAERSSTSLIRDTVASLVSRAARAASTDPGVVMLKNELKAALLSDERLERHKHRGQRSERAWGWEYDVMDASVLHADDVKAYMGRVVEGAATDVPRLPVSLRELADRVDRWMNEVTETTNTMTSQLTACNDDVTRYRDDARRCQDDVRRCQDDVTALQKKEVELEKKTTSLNDEITAQKKTTGDLQKTAESLNKKIETSGVMVNFTARNFNSSLTKEGSPIVFSVLTVNTGGGYDNTTGYFTAPVPGCYVFTASIGSSSKEKNVRAHIRIDGTQFYFWGSYASGGSTSVSVRLTKGQKVWVQANAKAEFYCSEELSFTGALVQPELQ